MLSAIRNRLRLYSVSWPLVAVIAIGSFAPLATRLFGSSVKTYLSANTRRLLTSDVTLTATRDIKDEELDGVRRELGIRAEAKEVEFVSVLQTATGQAGGLVELHAVNDQFPLNGVYTAREPGRSELISFRGRPTAANQLWITTEASEILEAKVGDQLKLGPQSFTVEKILESAPGQSRASFGFAPKVILRLEDLNSTNLITEGSIAYYRRYIDLKNPDARTDQIKGLITSSELTLRTADDAAQGLEKVADGILIFLALMSLLQFVLAVVAASTLKSAQKGRDLKLGALESLFHGTFPGIAARQIRGTVLNALIGSLLAFVLAIAVLYGFEGSIDRLMQKAVPGVPFAISVRGLDLGLLLLAIAFGGALLSLPVLMALRSRTSLRSLLGNSDLLAVHRSDHEAKIKVFAVTGAVLLIFAVAVLMVQSVKNAVLLLGGLSATLALIWFLCRPVLAAVGRLVASRGVGLSLLLSALLKRPRATTQLVFVVSAFASFLSAALLSVGLQMLDELSPPNQKTIPDFFAFNIPDGELERVQEASEQFGFQFRDSSPLVMARLVLLNGKPFPNTADTERVRQFPVRVTWRETLSESEKLVEGFTFREAREQNLVTGDVAMVSLEVRFAEQIGVRLGDRLGFDVQGVPIEAQVVSLRSVRWIEFQPNFFISFAPGVLDDAPKTWLGTLRFASGPPKAFLRDFQAKFTGVSLLNVREAIERIANLLKALEVPIRMSLLFTVLCAAILLFVTVVSASRQREIEVQLMHAFGASGYKVRVLLIAEYASVSGLASFLGSSLGLTGAALAGRIFFEWRAETQPLIGIGVVLTGLLFGSGLGAWIAQTLRPELGKSRRLV